MTETSTLLTTMADLVGKKIGVVDGANAGPKLAEKMTADGLITAEDPKGTSLEKRETYAELSKALEEGEVDAVCMDGCIARAYMEDDRVIFDERIDEEDYGVATQKGSELSSKVSKAVQEMLDDGTVEGLIEKWR